MKIITPTYNLFLDDERTPLDAYEYTKNSSYLTYEWVVVRNYDSFVDKILKNGLPKIISFDHDLADIHYKTCINVTEINYDILVEKTGYHCAKWLVNYCVDLGNIPLPKYFIHSMNFVGGKNIRCLLENYNKVMFGGERAS